MPKKFYLTTAIDYANGKPHLGHAYEKVLTDVIARSRRQMGQEVHFLTGTDEHGIKVQQSAQREGVAPQDFVDRIAPLFIDLCQRLNISNDDFIRTTEPRHTRVVSACLQKLFDQGEIYKAEYTGFYSVRQEQFVLEKERLPNGEWPEIYGEVIAMNEPNYYFRLSKYQDWLIEYIQTHPRFIVPRFRERQLLEFLKEPINDLCISRPKERLGWGIELPFDPGFVTYVWFDALLNYASAVGLGEERFADYWPADFNVIGKDILVPSHGVYWPIMLHALGVEPPKSLLVHGWWHLGGQKMSKSAGQIVNPLDLIDKFGADALRYFLIREMNVGQDSDFTEELFLTRYTSDLGNDLGNLVSRFLNMAVKYFEDGLPSAGAEPEEPEQTVFALWEQTRPALLQHFAELQFHTALESTFTFIRALNRYAEVRAPWKLAKSPHPEDQQRLRTSIATLAEGLRLASAALFPVTPTTSQKIHTLLGLETIGTWEQELSWGQRLNGKIPGAKTILFPRP
jgi:methionyl-tRNA synthetase